MSKRGPSGLFLLVKRSLHPVVWMPMLSFATLTALLITIPDTTSVAAESHIAQASVSDKEAANPEPTANTDPGKAAEQPTPATPANTPAAAPQPTNPASYCSVAAFGTPAQINPVSAASGVTIVTNPPTYYSFRGGLQQSDTLARATACARQQPALGGFHGVTSYTISTAYDTTNYGGDVCRVGNVRVTLHQSILLPSADMSGMPAEAIATWNAAAARLQAHEYEHVAINRSYAQSIHDQLTAVSGSCAQVATQASSIIETGKANMRGANGALDSRTNHGVQ